MQEKWTNDLSYILNYIPKNLTSVETLVDQCLSEAAIGIAKLTNNLARDNLSFAESFHYFDQIRLKLVNSMHALMLLELLHTEKEMRDLARNKILFLREYILKNLDGNNHIYQGLKKVNQELDHTQKYYRDQLFLSFNKNGMDLLPNDRQKFQELQLEINTIASEFDANIHSQNTKVPLTKQDLEGLAESFIENLEKDKNGNYLVGMDYPTYFRIMTDAKSSNTRKIIKETFQNRAYPENYEILEKLINKRDELSKLLGYKNYAEYDIMGEMGNDPKNIERFVLELETKLQILAAKDYVLLTENLPESVQLTSSHKLHEYDLSYVTNEFKKTNFNINEIEIASFFPMEKTMNGLLNIYSQIFSVNFEEISSNELWDETVRLVSVKKDNKILGYIFMDLFPRDGKYNHARVLSLQPSMGEIGSETYIPGAIVVICNFPKPTKDKPALFKRNELTTFFHEFGHALHGVFINSAESFLFNSEMAMTYGLPVKTDFVEVPSKLFEKWLTNKEILKNLSSHYETNEQLSDELLDKIIQYGKFNNGIFYVRQLVLTSLSLELYSKTKITVDDIQNIYKTHLDKYEPFMEQNVNNHYPAAFTHLSSYGAKYYSYIWADIFAEDIYTFFKDNVLSNEQGSRLYTELLHHGGSLDPNELLKNFLGREPSNEAFLIDIGLD
jgi:thimet oligopeptidase